MSVYVDPISVCIPNKNWRHNSACHLIGDTIAELHSFAASLGLKRSWFQDKTIAHYDLTVNKRRQAISLGAIEIDVKTFMKKMRRQRQGCAACEKGLVYVAKVIAYEDTAAMKKLSLCEKHRALLIETVNEVFGSNKNEM